MNIKRNLRWIFALVLLIPLIFATAYLSSAVSESTDGQETSSESDAIATNEDETNDASNDVVDDAINDPMNDALDEPATDDVEHTDEEVPFPLPLVEDMDKMAESDSLILYADRETAHFVVEDKRDGSLITSYPSPEHWQHDTTGGVWKESHLISPIFFEMINTEQKSLQAILASSIDRGGVVKDWTPIDGGFTVTFDMEKIAVQVPVQVTIDEDYVSITVLEEGFSEKENFEVINLKAYPFFGAVSPNVEDGFFLLPDGPGIIYNLKPNIWRDRTIYRQPVYGYDNAYNTSPTFRKDVRMPLIGYNTGEKSFLIVGHEGEEYSYAYAAPSAANATIYNWATFEHQYRLRYYQPTRAALDEGFYTYSKNRFEGDREVRYYMLENEQNDYAGMAARYRQYLMEEQNVTSKVEQSDHLPLHLSILGGDVEQGTFTNRYITGTTTEEAQEIIERLHEDGVEQMNLNWIGWQKGGVSNIGFKMDVARKLGGNSGMQSFVEFAHELGFPVSMTMNYNTNSDGKSFNQRNHSMQNEGGQLMTFTNPYTNRKTSLVSPKYQLERVEKTMKHYASYGIDGLHLNETGELLDTDYNRRYLSSRIESAQLQQEMLDRIKSDIGSVSIDAGNGYAYQYVDYIHGLDSDYSYDIFADEVVPFMQIVLHGLIPYSSGYANLWDEYETQFLRDIEYGAVPSYIMMNAKTSELKEAFTASRYYSVNFDDWEARITEDYVRYNEALGDVQDQYIVGHQTLRNNVKETTYEGGKRIIVNYNSYSVTVEGTEIPARDFIVLNGGGDL